MMRWTIKRSLDAATWVAFGLVVAGGLLAAGAWLLRGDSGSASS